MQNIAAFNCHEKSYGENLFEVTTGYYFSPFNICTLLKATHQSCDLSILEIRVITCMVHCC